MKHMPFFEIKLQFLLFNAKPKLRKQTWNENTTWKYRFGMLF